MKLDGSCHCGAITFEVEVDDPKVSLCHCTDCQALSGGAFRANVSVPAGGFRLLSGSPRSYIKTAESGNKRRHTFCGDCGTPIYASAVENTPGYGVRLGAIRQRAALKPTRQIWRRSALPWVDTVEGLPASEKG